MDLDLSDLYQISSDWPKKSPNIQIQLIPTSGLLISGSLSNLHRFCLSKQHLHLTSQLLILGPDLVGHPYQRGRIWILYQVLDLVIRTSDLIGPFHPNPTSQHSTWV